LVNSTWIVAGGSCDSFTISAWFGRAMALEDAVVDDVADFGAVIDRPTLSLR
jgi:hypothetical protein